MKNLFIKILVWMLGPVQKFLQKENPVKVVLATDEEFQKSILNFSHMILEERVKLLESNNAILTFRLLGAIEENTKTINTLCRGQEELLNLFNSHETNDEPELDMENTLLNKPQSVNKNDLN
jgi:hypothetical protein